MASVTNLVQLQFTPEQAKEIAAQVGWCDIDEAWVCIGSTTDPVEYQVQVPASPTLRFQRGDRVRLEHDGSTKYFYVTLVVDGAIPYLLLNGGSDYSLDATAITEIAYSRHPKPFGFPYIFNYTPTVVGFSVNPTATYRFCLDGTLCKEYVHTTVDGTSNSALYTITPAIPIGATYFKGCIAWIATDGGAAVTTPVRAVARASDVIRFDKALNAPNGWTSTATAKGVSCGPIEFEIR